MKLYTEEQLKELLSNMLLTTKQVVSIFEELTPIELPSDKDIENIAEKTLSVNLIGFITGAKWMKEQILNQNKR